MALPQTYIRLDTSGCGGWFAQNNTKETQDSKKNDHAQESEAPEPTDEEDGEEGDYKGVDLAKIHEMAQNAATRIKKDLEEIDKLNQHIKTMAIEHEVEEKNLKREIHRLKVHIKTLSHEAENSEGTEQTEDENTPDTTKSLKAHYAVRLNW